MAVKVAINGLGRIGRCVAKIIASRDDIKIPKNLKKLDICVNISSTDLRENLKQEYLPESIAKEVINYYKTEQNE